MSAPLSAISHLGSYSSSSVRHRVAIIFSRQPRRHRAATQPYGRPHTEPALRIPNYKECVAEKGHEACANLLPFFQWLYEHGIDVAA